jgi:hypothetical protein
VIKTRGARKRYASCAGERISLSSFYEMQRRGLGPELLEVLGTKIRRVTAEARAAWRVRMTKLAQSEAAQLEAQRRREIAAVAGRIAARSPLHISRRRQNDARRRGRTRG